MNYRPDKIRINPLSDISRLGETKTFVYLPCKVKYFFVSPDEYHTFSRRNSAHVASQIADIFAALDRYGFDYSINEEFAEASRDTAGIVVDPGRIYPAHSSRTAM